MDKGLHITKWKDIFANMESKSGGKHNMHNLELVYGGEQNGS